MSEQPITPVAYDATATSPELIARAAADYTHGWGAPDARALDTDSDGDH
jgi:hypothetical protein